MAVILFLKGPAAAPEARAVSLPAGTPIHINITDKVDSGVAKAGQSFTGVLADAVTANGRTVFAKGTPVSGRVIQAVSSGRLKKPASLTLQLTQIGSSAVTTDPLKIDGKSHLVRNAEFIGGGTALGAIIGAIAGGKKGAAIGAATGAGAGTAGAFLTGKKEIAIPSEAVLTFVTPGGTSTTPTTTTATRQPSSQPTPSRSYEPSRGSAGSYGGQPYFSENDQRVVRQYYSMNTANLPPGLAKRGGNLPPGLEKQLERNGTLPPGLQKRVQPFPEDLNRQLPRLPSGYSRVVVGNRALILDAANRILDAFNVR